MILYFDASSIVSLHLAERNRHDELSRLRGAADIVASSRVSYAEARAALDLARREPRPTPRLSIEAYQAAVLALTEDWPSYYRIDVSEQLVQRAGGLAEKHHLKGYDAVQLSSALALNEELSNELRFSTWDRALARAAQREGLTLAHEVTP